MNNLLIIIRSYYIWVENTEITYLQWLQFLNCVKTYLKPVLWIIGVCYWTSDYHSLYNPYQHWKPFQSTYFWYTPRTLRSTNTQVIHLTPYLHAPVNNAEVNNNKQFELWSCKQKEKNLNNFNREVWENRKKVDEFKRSRINSYGREAQFYSHGELVHGSVWSYPYFYPALPTG